MLKKKEQFSEERHGELGQAFNFTFGDLEANRAGFITSRQKRDLRLRFLEKIVMWGTAIVIWIIFIGYMALTNPRTTRADGALILIPIFVTLLVFIIIATWKDFSSDIREGKVQRFEGIAREIGVGKAWRKAFVVTENQLEFKLNKEQYRLTNEQGRFRIYVAPTSREILAIEAVLPEEG